MTGRQPEGRDPNTRNGRGEMGEPRRAWTVGYSGRTPDALREALLRRDAVLFDIRLSPRSRQPAWNRGRLEALLGTRYTHVGELGNLNYKTSEKGIELADPAAGLKLIREATRPVVLMCVCRDVEHCHRQVVADLLEAAGWRVEEMDWDAAAATIGGQLALPVAAGNAGAVGASQEGQN